MNNNRITVHYSSGLLSRISHSAGQYIDLSYSGGRLSSISDHTSELSVSYLYTDDQLSSVVDIHGLETQYSYYLSGAATHALQKISSPNGTENYYTYDSQGRLSEMFFNGKPPVTLNYGPVGKVSITDSASEAVYNYYYDETGNFILYQNPFGLTTRARYDNDYNLTQLIEPDGARSLYSYDANGNTNRITDPLEQVTRLNYTANSRLSTLTDAELKTLRYQNDENGNNTARVSPDLSSESYTYNDTGELTGKNNRRGKPILVERDANGRVTRIDYDDNTFVAYTYDSVGKLLSVEDVTGVTTMDYYANHLLRYIIYPDTRFLEYTYDSAGRRSSLTDQTGYQQNYSYNFDGQLEIISDGTGNILAQYSYDLSGRLTERTLGNGVNSTYQYDKSNRVTAIVTKGADGGVISDYAYAFDVNNRRTKVTSRDGVWDYSYDATGQLVAAAFTSDNPEVPSKTIEYVYDKVGNRIQEIVNGSSTAYDINNMNQYSQAGVFSYSYDLDGNLIEKSNGIDRWTYEYNDNNRLIRSVTPEGEKEYIYNGLGYLVSVIADGVAKNYMVDPMGFGNVVGEYDESGTLLSRYTHGLGLIAKDDNFYTFDGNGNTSEMTNAANEIINFYGYEPFGNNLFEGESVENDFEFVGQLGVREMGEDLIYMRNRFYSPALGRFMAEDPIGLAGGDVSFYRYVQNDPVNWVDPWGLAASEIRNPPGFSDRVKDKLRTDLDRVKNPDRYGENARSDTVMTYTGTAITAGAIGAAGAWKYGLQYSPYIGTAVGKAANDYWGTGQPGWFAAKDKLQGWLEDFKDWLEDDPCETN